MTTDFTGGDIGDRSTFSNSANPMTALDPLARVREMAKHFHNVIIKVGNCTMDEAIAFKDAADAFSALEAVLEIPDREENHSDTFENAHIKRAWNQRGIDVCSAISQALEGMK